MAQLAGISKESFYKVLNEFEQDNLIKIKGESYEIVNPERLKIIREKG
jgi:CRP-like cAMP-binding protein